MTVDVAVLRPRERVSMDPERMTALRAELGPDAAETLLSRATSELALLMAGMVRQYAEGDLRDFGRNLRSLGRMSDHVGMSGLGAAAAAVCDCLHRGDDTALAATWARLLRIAERALAAEWDLRGLSG